MFGFGLGEGLLIFGAILLFFGGKRLPELGKSMGKAINNFKSGLKENDNKDDNEKLDS